MTNNPIPKKIDRKKAIDILFRTANLEFLMDVNQKEFLHAYDNLAGRIMVISVSRQLGKSYFACILAIQTCLRAPDTKVVYIAPTIKDIKDVIFPTVKDILKDCPKDLLPKVHKNDGTITFPNGSTIIIAATEGDRADKMRGKKAHLIILDECGFMDGSKFAYTVASVALPMTTTTDGKIIMISTPPKNFDHGYLEFIKKAQFEGNYIKKVIYDNPRLTPAQIQELADACGGVDSNSFRREYLCEIIVDTTSVVIPEFTKELQAKIIKEVEKPTYFDGYVGYDIGGTDNHAMLIGYYDYLRSRLIIEDELVINGVTTDVIASELKLKEAIVFNGKLPYMRIADNNNVQLIFDLAMKHQLTFLPAIKDNRDAAINNMRMLLKQEKIIINPRCVNLISHLENVMWNKQRTGFIRSTVNHYDTVPALYYMLRLVDFTKDPYPVDYINYELTHVSPKNTEYKTFNGTRIEKQSVTANALDTLFKPALNKIRRRF